MRYEDYQHLSLRRQMDYLYIHGTYIGKRKVGSQTAVLYQLHEYYVEIVYRRYRRLIAYARTFRSVLLIEPYLDAIALDGLSVAGGIGKGG